MALSFRAYIVTLLTLADLGIALWLAKNHSMKTSLFFFLNPISIVITGYHNQFDNIAVFFALLSVSFVDDKNENITKNDAIAIMFLSLSLITKHILYAFSYGFWFVRMLEVLLSELHMCAFRQRFS